MHVILSGAKNPCISLSLFFGPHNKLVILSEVSRLWRTQSKDPEEARPAT